MAVLKLSVVAQRRALCSKCPHAVKHTAWLDRKFYCGKIFSGEMNDRSQFAYLPTLTEDPAAACFVGKWGIASRNDLAVSVADLTSEIDRNDVFHALWTEVHNPTREWTQAWWNTVLLRLPRGNGCDCNKHAAAYMAEHPIPFGDNAACRVWAVVFHNSINTRLGKPVLSIADAQEKWIVGK